MRLAIGHVVLKVTSLDISVPFYCNVLGMRNRRRRKVNGREIAFLTFGRRDHDIGLVEVGAFEETRDETRAGLGHVAFCIGDSVEQLRAFKKHLDAVGIEPERMAEHRVSRSIYVRDPDGIELEIYVDSGSLIREAGRSDRSTITSGVKRRPAR